MVKKGSFTGSRFSLDSSPISSSDTPFLFRRRSSHASTTSTLTDRERTRRPSGSLGLSPSSLSRQSSASAAISMSEASRKRISLDVPWWRAKKNSASQASTISSSTAGSTASPRYVKVRATDFIDARIANRHGAKQAPIEARPAVAKPRPPSIEFPKLNSPLSPGKNITPFSPTQLASPSKPPTYVVDDKERLEKLDAALQKAGLKESVADQVPDENSDRDASLENVGLRRLSSNARDDIDTSISSWSERASAQKPPVNDILWPRPERPNLIIKSSIIPPIAARCFYPSPPPLPTPPMSERSSFTSEGALRSSITETDSDGHISESDSESTTSSLTENILRQSWNSGKMDQNPANSSMTSTVLSGSSSEDDNRQKVLIGGNSTVSGNTSTIAHRNQGDEHDENSDGQEDNNDGCDDEASGSEEEDVRVDSEYGGDIVDSEEEITRDDPRTLKAGFVSDGDETETESNTESESEAEEEAAEISQEDPDVNASDGDSSNNSSLPFLNISEDGENEPFVNASEDSSDNSSSSGGTVAMNDEMRQLLKRTEEEVELTIATKKAEAAAKREETYGEDGFSEADPDDLWSDSEPSSVESQARQMIRNATPLPKRAKKPSKLVARFFDPDNEAETSKVQRGRRKRFSAYASSSKRISKGALAARLKDREVRTASHSRRPGRRAHATAEPSPSMDLSTVSVASSDEEFDPNMD